MVPSSDYVWASQLAVSENGDAILGWLQGQRQEVCSERCPPGPPWHGYRVMVTDGTAAGGFGAPVKLNAHGAGQLDVAQVAGSSYVAWTGLPEQASRWRIVAIRHGRASVPTLLGARDQLVGLFTGRSRNAAAVWSTANGRGWPMRYAWLDARGRLGRTVTIATAQGFVTGLHVDVNDRGQLAAAWVQGSQYHPTAVLVLCGVAGRCGAPRRLRISNEPADALESVAVTLADDGTATALIAGSTPGNLSSFGLWGIVTHVGRGDGRLSRIAASGIDVPVATDSGPGGAIALFNPTPDSLAWTFLSTGTDHFSNPTPLPDDMTSGAPVIAANLSGRLVVAWNHFTRLDDPTYELRATAGAGDRPGTATVLVAGNQDLAEDTTSTGIDGRGDAIITWRTSSGLGLYEATHP